MTTATMKFSDIESIKILFKPTKRVCLVERLNNTSQNKHFQEHVNKRQIKTS